MKTAETHWMPLCLLLALAALASPAQKITSPEEHLGRQLGTDFQLADWEQVSSWYRRLGEESPRVITRQIGTTTEGRDFLISIISSPENLENLEAIQQYAAIIADPRGHSDEAKREAVEKGKVILLVSPQMHSTETAGTEAAMKFVHALATSEEAPWTLARENLVVAVFACTNPDGLDHVVQWYREHVGTPFEASGMLKLYQLYTGHDNNRDWFMLTQAETRIVTEQLYTVWRPQVYWDMHQQASNRERMFVPPYRDPLNPNLDPAIVAGVNLIGMRAQLDMTREGLTGVASGVKYENWAGVGNRGAPARHNMVAILTELASANIASPVFQKRADLKPVFGQTHAASNQHVNPWPGGWWRIGDIIKYELAFGRSLLGTINREPRLWLSNALEANQRAIEKGRSEGVRGWVIPADERDVSAVRRIIDALIGTGVEIHVGEGELKLDGRTYPTGSIVIRRDQPWGAHVKDLFEVQRYPKGYEPYDVAGWTLPLLMGVRRVEVMQGLDDVRLKRVEASDGATAGFAGDARVKNAGDGAFSSADSASWTTLARLLGEKKAVAFEMRGDHAGLFIPADAQAQTAANGRLLSRLPRIGIYSPWSGSMDEGWLRWVFDTWKIPYATVRNEQLRAGKLADFIDVLIVPDISASTLDAGRAAGSVHEEYSGGLAPEGSVAVGDFVRGGGTLITLGSASKWAIDLFELPLIDATRTAGARSTTVPSTSRAAGDEQTFACPGSVLRGVPQAHDLTVGLPESLPLMFSSSAAWRTSSKAGDAKLTTMLRYANRELLLSGYINRPEVIAGESAWVRAGVEKGRVHLFAFQPHYRSWSQGCFQLIFRAALIDGQPTQ
jgi:hypothetical protein